MPERVVRVGDLELWTEDFGDPADETILLNSGGAASGLFWSERFCEDLAGAGRHVIRYDYRDVGRSSSVDFETNPYTWVDLAADAVGILDGYAKRTAHFVGWSSGGTISQAAALDHPDRVASITSISSTALRSAAPPAEGARELPEEPAAFRQAAGAIWAAKDESERLDRFVAFVRVQGVTEPFDEADWRALSKRLFEHSDAARDAKGGLNLVRAGRLTPQRSQTLAEIRVPTLVIQGANDRIRPLPHGEATAAAIPGSQLLVIECLGHIPRPEPPEMLRAIIEHTAPA